MLIPGLYNEEMSHPKRQELRRPVERLNVIPTEVRHQDFSDFFLRCRLNVQHHQKTVKQKQFYDILKKVLSKYDIAFFHFKH